MEIQPTFSKLVDSTKYKNGFVVSQEIAGWANFKCIVELVYTLVIKFFSWFVASFFMNPSEGIAPQFETLVQYTVL